MNTDSLIDKPKLKDLDTWYKDNAEGSELDDAMRLRNISWAELSYERKLSIWTESTRPVKSGFNVVKYEAGDVSNCYHAQSQVIAYFKKHYLLHPSGDYRHLAPLGQIRCLVACADVARHFPRIRAWAISCLLELNWDYYSQVTKAYD